MNCPVCQRTLRPVQAGHVTVDVCIGGCGGLWLDNFELQKLDGPDESSGELLVNVVRKPDVAIDHAQKRRCPRCVDIVMMRHFFSPQRRVEVDECGNCGGFWLDAGELAMIRDENQLAAKQREAREKQLSDLAARHLNELRSGGVRDAASARHIERTLRFVASVRYEYYSA